MVSPADYRYLSGPDVTGAFAKGAEFVSAQETAEQKRRLAEAENLRREAQNRRREIELGMKQRKAAQAAANQAALMRQFERLGAPGGQPSQTTRPRPTAGVQPMPTVQLPRPEPTIPDSYFETPGEIPEYTAPVPEARPQPTVTPGLQPEGTIQMPGLSVTPTTAQPPTQPPTQPSTGLLGAVLPSAAEAPATSPSATLAQKYPEVANEVKQFATVLRDVKPLPTVPTDGPEYATKQAERARKKVFDRNIRALTNFRPSSLFSRISDSLNRRYTSAQMDELRAFRAQSAQAQKWYGSTAARKIFEENPDLFPQAAADPIAFYEQYKQGGPSVAGVTVTPTQPGAPTRTDANREFLPSIVTQGLTLGKRSFVEAAEAAPPEQVAPVSAADLLDAERRRDTLQRFDQTLSSLRTQGQQLAVQGKTIAALNALAKYRQLVQERARYARLVEIAEFNISGNANLIDKVVREGSQGRMRIGETSDPNTFMMYRRTADGQMARAGTMTKTQLVEDYKRYYDSAYAKRKQEEAADSRKRALDLVVFESKEKIKSRLRMLEKNQGGGKVDFRQDPANPSLTIVLVNGRPSYGYEVTNVAEKGAQAKYKAVYYKL